MWSSLHIAPYEHCSCGFHAFGPNSLKVVRGFMAPAKDGKIVRGAENLVLLWVGLAGWTLAGKTYESGDRAARAQRQQVAKVHIPNECGISGCHGTATCLGTVGEGPVSREIRQYEFLRPICPEHSPRFQLSLNDCEKQLGIPVVWCDPMLD